MSTAMAFDFSIDPQKKYHMITVEQILESVVTMIQD